MGGAAVVVTVQAFEQDEPQPRIFSLVIFIEYLLLLFPLLCSFLIVEILLGLKLTLNANRC